MRFGVRCGKGIGERGLEADHWAQIGWNKGFDAPSLYARILEELKARGL